MTVLIAGAGIGGLTLGLTLHQLGIPFRVFEAVDELRPFGVGINLQPHASRELFELGLERDLDAAGLRTEEVAYFSRHGKAIWSEPRGLKAGYRWPQYSIHRGHMQMALYRAVVDRAGEGAVVSGHALADWQDGSDGITVNFADRRTGKALRSEAGTLLIAADGINSTARARLFPNEGPASWGGTMMWRGVTRGPRFLTGRSVAMTGVKAVKFVCYPIADDGDGSVLNWVADLAMPPDTLWRQQDWNREGRLEDFLPAFNGWTFDWLDIPNVIRSAEAVYEFPMVDREPLDRWTHGRMTLLGDAAHAMYPIGSNGASQGILDARILGRCLRDHGVTPEALIAYDDARREEVNAVVLANRGDGPDKILDIVDERAPAGFDQIGDVISQEDLARSAGAYKAVAGMDIAALNARPSIL